VKTHYRGYIQEAFNVRSSKQQGARSKEQGARSKEQGARSKEQAAYTIYLLAQSHSRAYTFQTMQNYRVYYKKLKFFTCVLQLQHARSSDLPLLCVCVRCVCVCVECVCVRLQTRVCLSVVTDTDTHNTRTTHAQHTYTHTHTHLLQHWWRGWLELW
jgi:hypothetical protein